MCGGGGMGVNLFDKHRMLLLSYLLLFRMQQPISSMHAECLWNRKDANWRDHVTFSHRVCSRKDRRGKMAWVLRHDPNDLDFSEPNATSFSLPFCFEWSKTQKKKKVLLLICLVFLHWFLVLSKLSSLLSFSFIWKFYSWISHDFLYNIIIFMLFQYRCIVKLISSSSLSSSSSYYDR